MKCKFCHAEIDIDAKFCTNCGKDLSKLRRCTNCHEIIDDDSDFCPYCGSKQPDVKVCPNCGSYLDLSERACAKCGYSFYKEKETVSIASQSQQEISVNDPQEERNGSESSSFNLSTGQTITELENESDASTNHKGLIIAIIAILGIILLSMGGFYIYKSKSKLEDTQKAMAELQDEKDRLTEQKNEAEQGRQQAEERADAAEQAYNNATAEAESSSNTVSRFTDIENIGLTKGVRSVKLINGNTTKEVFLILPVMLQAILFTKMEMKLIMLSVITELLLILKTGGCRVINMLTMAIMQSFTKTIRCPQNLIMMIKIELLWSNSDQAIMFPITTHKTENVLAIKGKMLSLC